MHPRSSKEIQQAYDMEYYLRACGGYEECSHPPPPVLPVRLRDALNMAALRGTEDVLDVGCGRGELVSEAARLGCRAVGIDYSPDAIALARKHVQGTSWEERCHFLMADLLKNRPVQDKFDIVFALDILEHLSSEEMRDLLALIAECLKPEGRLIFHTSPNRYFYTVSYRLAHSFSQFLGRNVIPPDGRCSYERQMHINELTVADLRRAMAQSGLECDIKSFGLERLMKSIKESAFGRSLSHFFSYWVCHPLVRCYTNSDIIGMAAYDRQTLDECYNLPSSGRIPLDHPLFFHEGWYVAVLESESPHRWSSPYFSVKGWSERPIWVFLRFSQLDHDRFPIGASCGVRGFQSGMFREGADYLLWLKWPATARPIVVDLFSRGVAGFGDDPRRFGACLEKVWCEDA